MLAVADARTAITVEVDKAGAGELNQALPKLLPPEEASMRHR